MNEQNCMRFGSAMRCFACLKSDEYVEMIIKRKETTNMLIYWEYKEYLSLGIFLFIC